MIKICIERTVGEDPYVMRMKGDTVEHVGMLDYSQCDGTSTKGVRVAADILEGCAYVVGMIGTACDGLHKQYVTCRNGKLTTITKEQAEAMR